MTLETETGDVGAVVAAVRVYEGLNKHFTPILGSAGFQVLLRRCAKLTSLDKMWANEPVLTSSSAFGDHLRTYEAGAVVEIAVALFGAFFALLSTFIGERLTTQVLRSAWPTLEETAPKETES